MFRDLLDVSARSGALLALCSGCSLAFDPPVGQCASDVDCAALSVDGRCDLAAHVCVTAGQLSSSPRPPPAPVTCGSPSAVSAYPFIEGSGSIPPSPDCACVEGAYDDPSALVIGVIAPETFGNRWSNTTLSIPFVPRWEKALSLALEEWRQSLPDGRLPGSKRPLALMYCNSNDDPFKAKRAFSHLTEVAHAPLVITAGDRETDAVSNLVNPDDSVLATRGRKAALVCSICFGQPPPPNPSFIWRIAPALVTQAPLAAAQAVDIVQLLPASLGAAAPRVVFLSQDSPGFEDFSSSIGALLSNSPEYSLIPVRTADPRASEIAQARVADLVIDAAPSVIVVGLDSDFTTYYLRLIEDGWPATLERPQYVLTYLNQELGLLRDGIGENEDLRRRIRGTGWFPGAAVMANLSGLEHRFFARHQQPLDQVQFGYDAVYAAMYALLAADRTGWLDAEGVQEGFGHLSSGPTVNVGPGDIASGLVQLSANDSIDLMGSSSQLRWAPLTQVPSSDVTIWCLARTAAGDLRIVPSAGPVWNETEGIRGSYDCPELVE